MSVLRSRRALAVAGLAGIASYVWATANGIPRPIERVAALGGDALSRRGGVVMDLALGSTDPSARDEAVGVLGRRLATFGDVSVEQSGELARVTVVGVPFDRAGAAQAAVQVGGRIELAVVLEHGVLIDAIANQLQDPSTHRDLDVWTPEDSSTRHAVPFLVAQDRAALERAIARLPAALGERVVIERVIPEARAREPLPYWRTYVIATDTWEINGAVIAANTTWDPNTDKPIVQVDFNFDGRRRFGELTSTHVGEKIAFLLDGEVSSAPIVNGPILGGKAIVTMGGDDRDHMQDEADALVSVLEAGTALPFRVVMRAVQVIPPSAAAQTFGRALTALAAILLALAIAWPLVRWPGLRASGASAGRSAAPSRWRASATRALVTAIVLAWLVGLHWIVAPGVDREVLHGILRGPAPPFLTQAALGVSPIVLAYLVVELAGMVVPSWRSRAPAVITLAAALAVVEGWSIAVSVNWPGLDPVVPHGMRWEFVAAVTASVGAHAAGAFAIDRWGLGRGWSAILVLDVLVMACRQAPNGSLLAAVALLAPLAVVTVRTRIGETGASVRAPIAGFVGAALPLLVAVVLLPLQIVPSLHVGSVLAELRRPLVVIPAATLIAAGLGALWTRRLPGFERWRAIALSAGSAAGLLAIDLALHLAPWTGAAIALAAAALADMIVEARARARGAWTPIAELADVDAADDLLADDGAARVARGLHVRSLLRGLGPMVPIEVLESSDHQGVPVARHVRGAGGPG